VNKEDIVGEFVKCHSRLWAMAHAITRDHHLTEDVLQNVSLVLLNKAEQFDESRSFVAWALGITRLQAFKLLDKRSRDTSHIDKLSLDTLESTISDNKHEERLLAMKSCLKKISHENFQIMQMKYVNKQSAREIAVKIERTETGTHSLLQRLRCKVHRCILQHLAEES